jgi:hypothetical protein
VIIVKVAPFASGTILRKLPVELPGGANSLLVIGELTMLGFVKGSCSKPGKLGDDEAEGDGVGNVTVTDDVDFVSTTTGGVPEPELGVAELEITPFAWEGSMEDNDRDDELGDELELEAAEERDPRDDEDEDADIWFALAEETDNWEDGVAETPRFKLDECEAIDDEPLPVLLLEWLTDCVVITDDCLRD